MAEEKKLIMTELEPIICKRRSTEVLNLSELQIEENRSIPNPDFSLTFRSFNFYIKFML